MPTFFRSSLALALSVSLGLSSAQAKSFFESFLETTPAGLMSASSNDSFDQFSNATIEGAKTIVREGDSLFIVPFYTNHPTWAWDQRAEENAYPLGAGYARQIIDEKGNERTLFAITFIDSNYRPEPTVGYTWIARQPISNDVHIGAGYMAGLTARGDYMWLPLPLVLPVFKVGTENLGVYMSYIPITNVFFFYSTYRIDDKAARSTDLTLGSPWMRHPTVLFAGAGRMRVDNGEEDTPYFFGSGSSYSVALRHNTAKHWTTEFSYRKSHHDMRDARLPQASAMSYQIENYSLALQYNIEATERLRLFVGGGFGYSRAKNDLGQKDTSVHPVTQAGFTYALSEQLQVTSTLHVSYARFKDVNPNETVNNYTLRSTPADFNVSLGYAF